MVICSGSGAGRHQDGSAEGEVAAAREDGNVHAVLPTVVLPAMSRMPSAFRSAASTEPPHPASIVTERGACNVPLPLPGSTASPSGVRATTSMNPSRLRSATARTPPIVGDITGARKVPSPLPREMRIGPRRPDR